MLCALPVLLATGSPAPATLTVLLGVGADVIALEAVTVPEFPSCVVSNASLRLGFVAVIVPSLIVNVANMISQPCEDSGIAIWYSVLKALVLPGGADKSVQSQTAAVTGTPVIAQALVLEILAVAPCGTP